MKLVFVRHADPDYSIDSLTERGWIEEKHLTERMLRMNEECGGFREIYTSPLGRAKDTASGTLKALNREAIVLDWLMEFPPQVNRPDTINPSRTAWDWLPADWTSYPDFYHPTAWKNHPAFIEGNVGPQYDRICEQFDELLASHGYRRHDNSEGIYYDVTNASNDTIVFFCHFGLECVLVSHLCNMSPMILWHNFCAAPSSISIAISEERREGIASFRMNTFGDISHLYANHQPPAFSARFCECFTNENERHDLYM